MSGVSFILGSILLNALYNYFSTKIDKYSIAVTHPLSITLTEFSLCASCVTCILFQVYNT